MRVFLPVGTFDEHASQYPMNQSSSVIEVGSAYIIDRVTRIYTPKCFMFTAQGIFAHRNDGRRITVLDGRIVFGEPLGRLAFNRDQILFHLGKDSWDRPQAIVWGLVTEFQEACIELGHDPAHHAQPRRKEEDFADIPPTRRVVKVPPRTPRLSTAFTGVVAA